MEPLALPLLMALSPQVFVMSQRTLLVAPAKDNDEMRSIAHSFFCVAPTGSFGAASSPDRLSPMDRKPVLTTRRRTTAASLFLSFDWRP